MIYVLLFIFPKWMLAKTVSAMKLIFHSGRQGPQMWIYCPDSNPPTPCQGVPMLSLRKQQEIWHSLRCSTLTSAAHQLPPTAVQRRRTCSSNSSQGQGIWAASALQAPQWPVPDEFHADHCQFDWATAVVQPLHPLAGSWCGDVPTRRSHSHSHVSAFLGSHALMPRPQQQENSSLIHQAPPCGSPCTFLLPRKTAFHQLSEFLFSFVLNVLSTLVSSRWNELKMLQMSATECYYLFKIFYVPISHPKGKTARAGKRQSASAAQLKNRIKNQLIHLLHDKRSRMWLLSLLWESRILYLSPCLAPSKPSVVVRQSKSSDQV